MIASFTNNFTRRRSRGLADSAAAARLPAAGAGANMIFFYHNI